MDSKIKELPPEEPGTTEGTLAVLSVILENLPDIKPVTREKPNLEMTDEDRRVLDIDYPTSEVSREEAAKYRHLLR